MEAPEGREPIRALEIDGWPRSGLPWIAFWIKELITWGTLDPVAAFILSRGAAINRPQAEEYARDYYAGLPPNIDPNDALNPSTVRDWVDVRLVTPDEVQTDRGFVLEATLARPVNEYLQPRLTVSPVETKSQLSWIDPAGYVVASSGKPATWPDNPAALPMIRDNEGET